MINGYKSPARDFHQFCSSYFTSFYQKLFKNLLLDQDRQSSVVSQSPYEDHFLVVSSFYNISSKCIKAISKSIFGYFMVCSHHSYIVKIIKAASSSTFLIKHEFSASKDDRFNFLQVLQNRGKLHLSSLMWQWGGWSFMHQFCRWWQPDFMFLYGQTAIFVVVFGIPECTGLSYCS